MLVLAVDTSATAAVALHDGARVLARRVEADPRRHAELLAPAVAAVLADAGRSRAELTHVAVGTGPAPYTGLRVGVVTALVLGEALGLPVHGVCSLDALLVTAVGVAARRGEPLVGEVVAVTDAKRREVHWARYRVGGGSLTQPDDRPDDRPDARPDDQTGDQTGGRVAEVGWTRLDGPHVSAPAEVPALPVVGAGAALLPARSAAAGHGPPSRPELLVALDPGCLAAVAADRIARGLAPGAPRPLYLRRPDAVPLASPVQAPTGSPPLP